MYMKKKNYFTRVKRLKSLDLIVPMINMFSYGTYFFISMCMTSGVIRAQSSNANCDLRKRIRIESCLYRKNIFKQLLSRRVC